MAIDNPSRDYKAQRSTWALIRSLGQGADEARAHVIAPPSMGDDRFANYRARAYYLPALPRTVEFLAGLAFLRDPLIKAPDAVQAYIDDVDLAGTTFANLASQVVGEQIEASRVAVLVDCPPSPEGLTKAEAEKRGIRAYARVYATEAILGVDQVSVGGVLKTVDVRLAETEIARDAEYNETEVKRVRQLRLVGNVYTQTVWQQDEGGKWFVVETATPQRNGAPLDYIPIFFFNHRDHSPVALRPPLADLSDVSVAHLNNSASMEWALMWTANPTPWVAGLQAAPVDANGNVAAGAQPQVRLGSSEMLCVTENGKVGYLEFEGSGLEAIRQEMDRKEKHMAALGTRVLLDDPRGAIAAETARIQRAGENSTLGKIVSVASSGLTWVLRELALWAGVRDISEISVTVNKNFVLSGIKPEEIKALLSVVQGGEMSSREFFDALKAADIISPAKEYDLHIAEIEEDDARLAARDLPEADPEIPAAA